MRRPWIRRVVVPGLAIAAIVIVGAEWVLQTPDPGVAGSLETSGFTSREISNLEDCLAREPPDIPRAKQILDRIRPFNRKNDVIIFWEGRIQYAEGKYDAAEKSFDLVIDEKPSAVSYYWRGMTLGQQDRLFEQIGEYRRALGFDEGFAAAHRGLGDAEFGRNNFFLALEHYKNYEKHRPEDQTILRDFARCWTSLAVYGEPLSARRAEDALSAWRAVLNEFPADCEAFMQIANVHRASGHADLAIRAYEAVMSCGTPDAMSSEASRAYADAGCQLALLRAGALGPGGSGIQESLRACAANSEASAEARDTARELIPTKVPEPRPGQ